MTPPIPEQHLYRLTFWSRHSTKVRIDLDEDTQYNNPTADSSGGWKHASVEFSFEDETFICFYVFFLDKDGGSVVVSAADKAREAAEFLQEPRDLKRYYFLY